jgi:hypothetical protein
MASSFVTDKVHTWSQPLAPDENRWLVSKSAKTPTLSPPVSNTANMAQRFTISLEDIFTAPSPAELESAVKILRRRGLPTSVLVPVMPLSTTYLHAVLADCISRLADFGCRIVLHVQDVMMLESEAFRVLFRPDVKPEETIRAMVTEFVKLCVAFGCDVNQIEPLYLSESIRRFFSGENTELVLLWNRVASALRPSDVLSSSSTSSLAKIMWRSLDVFVCSFSHILYQDIDEGPIRILLVGEGRRRLYTTVRDWLDKMRKSEIIRPPLLLFTPDLPQFGQKGGPYLGIDHDLDYILKVVLSNLEREEEKVSREQLENLCVKVLKPQLAEFLLTEGKALPWSDVSEFLRDNIQKKDQLPLAYALSMNLYRYLNMLNSRVSATEKGEPMKRVPWTRTCSDIESTQIIASQLSNPKKLRILSMANGNASKSEIATKVGIKLPTVSSYVKQLEKADLLTRRQGKPLRKWKEVRVKLEDLR